MNTLYMIGNTHFDSVWLWTWDEAMASIRSTFRSALDRMKEDPDFVYSFSTPAVFEWIEEEDGDLFREIQARVAGGRWDVEAEGWWLQPDCNAPCGESLVRQGLYGQQYLRDRFDKQAGTVFNIDSFGHSAMIPQIMRKCGLRYYVFSRPNKGERQLEDELFRWQSPDGSEVLAYRPGGQIGGEGYPQDVANSIREITPYLLSAKHDVMIVYGVSNHGGAPTKAAIAAIREAAGEAKDHSIRFGSTKAFFAAQEGKELFLHAGELQTRFYGPFSDHSEIKNNNRRGEYALLNAEKAALLAQRLAGRQYPAQALRRGWKDLLFNQFHDILGGTCISEAYVDARNLHGRLLQTAGEITHFGLQSVTRQIKTPGNNEDSVWNICLFNLNTTPYRGIVEAEVQWAWEFPWYTGGIELLDEDGNVTEAQIILEKSVIPGFRTRFAFAADIPPVGYRTYAVRQTNASTARDYSETQVKSPFLPKVYVDEGDTWCFNTVDGYGPSAGKFAFESAKTVEKGPLFTTVKQTWCYESSIFEEYITTYEDADHVDYRYRVNWNEHHKVLKLVPNGRNVPKNITAAIPYGSLERPADGIECPVGEWLRWSDAQGGATLLLDGVYAYDTAEDSLRLTLLRSPIYGDLRTEPLDGQADYPYMGQGIHTGRIRLIPRALHNGEAMELAIHFNNPPISVCEANHPGGLSASGAGLRTEGTGALITAMKEAEDGDGMILRMVETEGAHSTLKIALGDSPPVEIALSPYEIKTMRFATDGSIRETDMLEAEQGL
ncbi:MAG: glycoside hydrolase family 38 C-terminal domain-containing protein [Oscillospiraceae bacterium]